MGWLGSTYRGARRVLGVLPPVVRQLDRMRVEAGCRRDSLLASMIETVPPGSVVFDVGAGLGLYALALAERVPRASIYAFEPNAPTWKSLRASIALHGMQDRIHLEQLAVGDTLGEATLFLSTEAGRSGLLAFNAARGNGMVSGTASVRCTTVDELVRSGACPVPNAIKIDVEGYEYEVIDGARQTLIEHRPLIFFDGHAREDPERRYPAILRYLMDLGYEVENRKPVFLAWPSDSTEETSEPSRQ